jgi:hypothetical protein
VRLVWKNAMNEIDKKVRRDANSSLQSNYEEQDPPVMWEDFVRAPRELIRANLLPICLRFASQTEEPPHKRDPMGGTHSAEDGTNAKKGQV